MTQLRYRLFCLLAILVSSSLQAQVYSPWVLREGQPDTRDLRKVTEALYRESGARTDRDKAEAIWRYLLTDGRFVEPGVFYHIAGWAYEEPQGEVLDPVKLLNSYGFGLCYQVAPLLEALWEAGGFSDARTWFVTGHTVTEVYFDGKYNMLDSDMLGYTTVGEGKPGSCPIASVRELERDDQIILGKMLAEDRADASKVMEPWYPADVRAKAMGGYAELFTSRDDNWLFTFKRYPSGHSMDWVLRPGEKMTLYYRPEAEGLFYLPFKQVGGRLEEFPREFDRWNIRTEDGPHSQKDHRLWATGRIEYRPPLHQPGSYYPAAGPGFTENLLLPSGALESLKRLDATKPGTAVIAMQSPYVLIDAVFEAQLQLSSAAHRLTCETSIDGGRSWAPAGSLKGPFSGPWRTGPGVLSIGEHGSVTALSGRYGYLVKLVLSGPSSGEAELRDLVLKSLIQLNPRTLPRLQAGSNRMLYSPGAQRAREIVPVDISRIDQFAAQLESIEHVEEASNSLLVPTGMGRGELIFELSSANGKPLESFQAGGRFMILRGLAPEKLTAEIRPTALTQSPPGASASLSWSTSNGGPWNSLWTFEPATTWLDGEPENRLLIWPEVDETVTEIAPNTTKVYVRFALDGMALDSVRLALSTPVDERSSHLVLTHNWSSSGQRMSFSREIDRPELPVEYSVVTGTAGEVENHSLVLECPVN